MGYNCNNIIIIKINCIVNSMYIVCYNLFFMYNVFMQEGDIMTTFKDLSKKDKIEHIWYYYKGIIIFAVIGIIMFTYLTLDYINKVDYVFNISLLAGSVESTKEDALEQDLTKLLIGENPGRKKVGFEDYQLVLNNGSLSLDMTQTEKFLITLSAGTSDLVIMSEDVYKGYKDKQIFADLTKLGGFNNKEYTMPDDCFISLDKSKKIKFIVKSSEKLFIAIPSTAKDKQKSIKCLEYLLK